MSVLDQYAVHLKDTQNLNCVPRIRIANLGQTGINYFFSKQNIPISTLLTSSANLKTSFFKKMEFNSIIKKSKHPLKLNNQQVSFFNKPLKFLLLRRSPISTLATGAICFVAGVSYSRYYKT
jgi:hypothetical protein